MTCMGARPDEVREAGDAREGLLRLLARGDDYAKFLLDAHGQFQAIQRVEAEGTTNDRGLVGNRGWLADIKAELIGNKLLQLRGQGVLVWAVVWHAVTIAAKALRRYGANA